MDNKQSKIGEINTDKTAINKSKSPEDTSANKLSMTSSQQTGDTAYFTASSDEVKKAKPKMMEEGNIFAKGSKMRIILRRILYIQEIAVILAILALFLDYFYVSKSQTSGAFPVLSAFTFSILLPLLGATIIADIIVVIYFLIKKHQ